NLDVDLADALERAPVERVLVEQLAGPGALDVTAAEVGAVPLQELDLRVSQDVGRVLGASLETQQTFVPGHQVVAHPHPAHPRRADLDVLHPQLVSDAL